MAELERLQRRRVAAKGWATRTANVLSDLLDQKPDSEIAGVDHHLAVLEARKECESRLASLDELQSAVECELDSGALAVDLEAAWNFREGIRRVLLRAEAVVRKQSDSDGQAASTAGGSGTGGASARLPKLELPKFDGNVLQWETFWESFRCAVDQLSELPAVHKLTYLRSLLVGEARRCVEGLPLKAENYVTTCELLKERFGRPELVIFAHIQQLLSISSAAGSKLQDLVDRLLVEVRSLEALGITGQQYGVILTPLLLSRLPSEVRLEWARTSVGKEGNLDHLISFLQQEISRLDRSRVYESLASPRASSGGAAMTAAGRRASPTAGRQGPVAGLPGRREARPAQRPSVAALQTASLGRSCCSYCGQQHPTAKCGAWQKLSVPDRFSWVREKGLCFCCLENTHLARRCADRCGRCGGRHHFTLWGCGMCAGSPRVGGC